VVGGYGAGTAMSAHIQQRVSERYAIAENWSASVFGLPERPGITRRIGMAASAGVALIGIPIGYAIGQTWEDAPSTKTQPAALNIVVDHSGATSTGENPVIDSINEAVEQFATQDIESKAIVASGGNVAVVEVEDVAAKPASGDAPLAQALQLAIDTSAGLHKKAIWVGKQPITGTVVLTNGNSIGDSEIVTTNAGGEPIFVINIENSAKNPGVSEGLKAIAENTGGQYWDIEATADEDVTKEISDAIVDARTEDDGAPIDWAKRICATALLGLFVPAYKRTKRESLANIKKARR
jgi:hypothetical protein